MIRRILVLLALPVAAAAQTRVLPAHPIAPAFGAAAPLSPSAASVLPSAALSAPLVSAVPALPAAAAADAPSSLSAAFDGGLPASLTPEQFGLVGHRVFEAILRAEARAGSALAESVPSDDDLLGRLERLPGTNPARESYIKELFKLGGARDEEIVFQDAGEGRHNIMVVKKGRTDRVIVVGGHHDKVRAGLGSIDNGTGSTMVANLHQALRELETDATIVFIAFAREEEGLLGSEAYLRSLTPEQKSRIDAMVNLDTLGVDGTFSWQNNSTRALLDRVRDVSSATGHPVTEAHLDGGDADSSSFRSAGIPAVTLYGASQEVIFDIIHTERDTMAAFDLAHYKNAYLLTLELLKSLDKRKLGPIGRDEV